MFESNEVKADEIFSTNETDKTNELMYEALTVNDEGVAGDGGF